MRANRSHGYRLAQPWRDLRGGAPAAHRSRPTARPTGIVDAASVSASCSLDRAGQEGDTDRAFEQGTPPVGSGSWRYCRTELKNSTIPAPSWPTSPSRCTVSIATGERIASRTSLARSAVLVGSKSEGRRGSWVDSTLLCPNLRDARHTKEGPRWRAFT